MKIAALFTSLVLVAALGCGGMVVIEGQGSDGGGGTGAAGSGNGAGGDAASCEAIECSGSTGSCSCKTTCMGPDLRADCAQKSDGTVVCECHYDDSYMGLCAHFGGDLCGLPGGCCLDYLAE